MPPPCQPPHPDCILDAFWGIFLRPPRQLQQGPGVHISDTAGCPVPGQRPERTQKTWPEAEPQDPHGTIKAKAAKRQEI